MSDGIFRLWDEGKRPPRGGGGGPPVGGGVPEDAWQTAPFRPLGKAGAVYWFFDAAGELVSLSARGLGQWQEVLGLAGGAAEWLARHFPSFDRDGNPNGGFNVRLVAAWIMQRAQEMPAFDPAEPRRRHGLWPVPGGAALHLGRSVIWNGRERRAGFSEAGALWPALAPRPAPAAAASPALGRELEALLGRWQWAHEDAPTVLLGLVVAGWLGGLAPWRAHGFVVGDQGTGKTTLLRFLRDLCPLSTYLNEFTEAGIRALLSETACNVILDESEGGVDGDAKLQRVIELLRRSSSGAGVQGVRGSPEQVARSFSVNASALMGAIFAPPLMPQDAARFTVLELRPLAGVVARESEFAEFAAAHGLALWGRAVEAASRIGALFRLLRETLIGEGCSPRVADQLGIVAAAAWAMTQDEYLDPRPGALDTLVDALAPVRWLIVEDVAAEIDSGGNQALQRLLAMPLDMAGDRLVLGQALARWRDIGRRLAHGDGAAALEGAEQEKLGRLLEGHGVRWGPLPIRPAGAAPAPPVGLYVVAGAHPRLARAFEGTPWGGQRWAAALSMLPGAKGGRDSPAVRIGGGRMRTCWVPRETLDRLLADGSV